MVGDEIKLEDQGSWESVQPSSRKPRGTIFKVLAIAIIILIFASVAFLKIAPEHPVAKTISSKVNMLYVNWFDAPAQAVDESEMNISSEGGEFKIENFKMGGI